MEKSELLRLLGAEAEDLLTHQCQAIPLNSLNLPGTGYVDQLAIHSNRNAATLRSLSTLFGHGRLAHTGYLSILPVDQGVEHGAGYSFFHNPLFFDPAKIVELAIEGGCNAVASSAGALALVSRQYAHKIPFVVKVNHNELLSYPNHYDQTKFASVREAWNLGAVAVGATVYFGSPESKRQITEIAECFEEAHQLGMATILWCYLRNPAFHKMGTDYHASADLTGEANYLGVTLQADLIKQKLAVNNGGFQAVNGEHTDYSKWDAQVYRQLCSSHPIDLCRYQVLLGFNGRIGLINSGGQSEGNDDLRQAIRSAVINKRAGGVGMIVGRKAFQHPFQEGVELLHSIQNVYLDPTITLA